MRFGIPLVRLLQWRFRWNPLFHRSDRQTKSTHHQPLILSFLCTNATLPVIFPVATTRESDAKQCGRPMRRRIFEFVAPRSRTWTRKAPFSKVPQGLTLSISVVPSSRLSALPGTFSCIRRWFFLRVRSIPAFIQTWQRTGRFGNFRSYLVALFKKIR